MTTRMTTKLTSKPDRLSSEPGIGMAAIAVLAILAVSPLGAQNDDPTFIRGDVNADFSVNAADVASLLALYEDLFDVSGGCTGSPPTTGAADVNDNGSALAETLTIADLIQLEAKLSGAIAALPPPVMCNIDPIESASDTVMDSTLRVTLESTAPEGGFQEVIVKVGRTSAAFQGAPLPLHGLGLVLHAKSGISDVIFVPELTLPAGARTIVMSPGDPDNPAPVLLLHLGSVTEIVSVEGSEIVLGRFSFPAAVEIIDPFTPPVDLDRNGFPDPVQVGGRTWPTTVVGKLDDCFTDPDTGSEPCFIDHVPVMGDAVIIDAEFRRGDANTDGQLDIADGVHLLQYLFLSGAAPGCEEAADFDGSGSLAVGDAMGMFVYQLLDGPQPPAPFPSCGAAPGGELLGCESYSPTFCD